MFALLHTEKHPLTFTAVDGPASVSLNIKKGTPVTNGLQYKLEGDSEWNTYTPNEVINLSENEYVQFQNTNEQLSLNTSNYVSFNIIGKANSSGNIQSLLNYIDEVPDYAFAALFSSCSGLVSPPELPATTVGQNGYQGMFMRTNITTAPVLPATTIGSNAYNSMFSRCSITAAPTLPAKHVGERAYFKMFSSCSALTTPPKILATTLSGTYNMYRMFYECTALTRIT